MSKSCLKFKNGFVYIICFVNGVIICVNFCVLIVILFDFLLNLFFFLNLSFIVLVMGRGIFLSVLLNWDGKFLFCCVMCWEMDDSLMIELEFFNGEVFFWVCLVNFWNFSFLIRVFRDEVFVVKLWILVWFFIVFLVSFFCWVFFLIKKVWICFFLFLRFFLDWIFCVCFVIIWWWSFCSFLICFMILFMWVFICGMILFSRIVLWMVFVVLLGFVMRVGGFCFFKVCMVFRSW